MPIVLNAPPKAFAWSFSAVDNFHTCGRKYYHQNIAKDVTDDTTARTAGGIVHDFMAKRLMHARPLPPHAAHWERWIDELLADCDRTRVILNAEQKLAITEDFEPCLYFDKVKKVWCRSVLDVVKVMGDKALVWDWKTGRMKPDEEQLMLCATMVFTHFPMVKTIDAALVFLKEDTGPSVPRNNCTYELRITRPDLKPFWSRYIHKVEALHRAVLLNEWNPIPSGLCKNHCPVYSCPHNGHF